MNITEEQVRQGRQIRDLIDETGVTFVEWAYSHPGAVRVRGTWNQIVSFVHVLDPGDPNRPDAWLHWQEDGFMGRVTCNGFWGYRAHKIRGAFPFTSVVEWPMDRLPLVLERLTEAAAQA